MISKSTISYMIFGLIIFASGILYFKIHPTAPITTDDTIISAEYCNQLPANTLKQQLLTIETDVSKYIFTVEIADTPISRETGLMCRNAIKDNTGMLFIFEESGYRSFWMKNTLIPLDIIFLDKNLKIINIHTNATPLKENVFYKSNKPAKYVLEIKGGIAEKIDINITSKIILP